MLDFSTDYIWVSIIKAFVLLIFLILSVIFAIWYLRRLIGRFQNRIGPNVRGPFGFFQVLFDAGKLILKEDIITKASHKILYIVAPFISVFSAFMVFSVIPMSTTPVRIPFTDFKTPLQLTDFEGSILFVLAMASIGVFGIVLGGWAANSTYPIFGSVRAAAQVVSYELVMTISIITVIFVANTASTGGIVAAQKDKWYIVLLFPSFVFYFISALGEINHLPFDLPEAEGELTGGYATEYSSMKFAWFYLSEFINAFNVSAVATVLFLGGGNAPWPISLYNNNALSGGWYSALWFLIKVWFFMSVFIWIRATLIRLRYDQFMKFCWKYLLPLNFGWFMFVVIEEVCAKVLSNPKMGISIDLMIVCIVILCIPSKKKKVQSSKKIEGIDVLSQYESRSLFKKIFGPVLGFAITGRNLFRKVVTIQYPNKKYSPAKEKFHGIHQLNRYDDGFEKCVGCELCAWSCPVQAINIVSKENDASKRNSHGEKYAEKYEIDYSRCIFCGFCIEACPTRALTMTNKYEIFAHNRNELLWGKDKLLSSK